MAEAVVGCADSRVPLELVFDVLPGEAEGTHSSYQSYYYYHIISLYHIYLVTYNHFIYYIY